MKFGVVIGAIPALSKVAEINFPFAKLRKVKHYLLNVNKEYEIYQQEVKQFVEKHGKNGQLSSADNPEAWALWQKKQAEMFNTDIELALDFDLTEQELEESGLKFSVQDLDSLELLGIIKKEASS